MQQVQKLTSENGDLSVNNATLKVQVVKQLVCVRLTVRHCVHIIKSEWGHI